MSVTEKIPLGAKGEYSREVTREVTVANFHPAMPEVFSTPAMIGLMESAAFYAVQPHLPEGWVSVGIMVNIQHLAATPVGRTVTATAEVIARDAKTITLNIQAHDGMALIGQGTHGRAAIEVSRFMARFQNDVR